MRPGMVPLLPPNSFLGYIWYRVPFPFLPSLVTCGVEYGLGPSTAEDKVKVSEGQGPWLHLVEHQKIPVPVQGHG